VNEEKKPATITIDINAADAATAHRLAWAVITHMLALPGLRLKEGPLSPPVRLRDVGFRDRVLGVHPAEKQRLQVAEAVIRWRDGDQAGEMMIGVDVGRGEDDATLVMFAPGATVQLDGDLDTQYFGQTFPANQNNSSLVLRSQSGRVVTRPHKPVTHSGPCTLDCFERLEARALTSTSAPFVPKPCGWTQEQQGAGMDGSDFIFSSPLPPAPAPGYTSEGFKISQSRGEPQSTLFMPLDPGPVLTEGLVSGAAKAEIKKQDAEGKDLVVVREVLGGDVVVEYDRKKYRVEPIRERCTEAREAFRITKKEPEK
jgi:hypothetical protein